MNLTLKHRRKSVFAKLPLIIFTAILLTAASVSVYARFNSQPFAPDLAAGAPLLLTIPNTTRAVALENITGRSEPFSTASQLFWGADNRNRIWLYASNLNLSPGDSVAAITATAQDESFQYHPLTVEAVEPVPECPDFSRMLVRLADDLGDNGDVLIGISFYGVSSNRVRIGIGHVGGGPPDDPTPGYSINGQVTDDNGLGLSEIPVKLQNASGAVISYTMSGTGGAFHFCELPAGATVTVSPSATTLLTFSPRTLVSINTDAQEVFIGQPRLYNISGRVSSTSGTGLSNAIVTGGDGFISTTALTDSYGNYSITGMKAGRNVVITAALAGFSILNPNISVSALDGDKTGINFTAAPESTPTPTPIPSSGPNFYVAPNGSPSGNGSINNPWDLQTALNQPANVVPGSTIYLRDGTYSGIFTSRLLGSASAPIDVRSYPGEWAKLDGFAHTTLAVSLPNAPGDPVTVVLNDAGLRDGSNVVIGAETIYLGHPQANGKTFTNCVRGSAATPISAHAAGDLAIATGNGLTINGQYTNYRDFEVLDSDTVTPRSFDSLVANKVGVSHPGGYGVFVNPGANSIKLINLVVHDNSGGIFAGEQADSLEIYGCIIYNNGFVDWDRGHGLGIYALNSGANPKKIRNVITLNGFVDGMKAYSESQRAENFLFEHVISFNNGVLASFPGNHGDNGAQLSPNHRYGNMYAGTGNSNNPINNIKIHDCYLYYPSDTVPEDGNLGLGYQAPGATGLEIINSRIMGGEFPLVLNHFSGLTVTGNKIYAQRSGSWTVDNLNRTLVSARLESPLSATWDNNAYFDQLPQYQGASYPFSYTLDGNLKHACDTGGILKYKDSACSPNGGWVQHTGFDTHSTYAFARPSGTEVFVIPNEYEVGRAHIAIYNWDLNTTVNADLSSVLRIGDRYAVYAAENYLGAPVLTGTYDGKPVAIPMTGAAVAAPIGLGWTPTSVRPQFGVFIVKKQ